MSEFFLFSVALASVLALVSTLRLEYVAHRRRLAGIPVRIHVNGIRGKSTVTRIIAGALRQQGQIVVAKTTGSAACVIDAHGIDRPIIRHAAPTILEQINFVKSLHRQDLDSVVVECMAVKPDYQKVCESHIIQSTIGVLTNVREDHQDQMGETLPEIAASLLNTCPRSGVLITSERNPELLHLIRNHAHRCGSQLIVVDPEEVSDQELNRFDYLAFKENVAIGLAVARQLGIERDVAMQGMIAAAPDPGVLRLKQKQVRDRHITWANLLAVNDRQSVITGFQRTRATCPPTCESIGLLNNRADREDRALRFAEIAARDLDLDWIALTGAYESQVERRLVEFGVAPDRIVCLGLQAARSLNEFFETLFQRVTHDRLFLAGMVNIHTRQAEWLQHFFEGETE